MGTPKEKGWYTMKVYEKLAMCANALRNSREKNNQEWVDKYEEDIANYLYEYTSGQVLIMACSFAVRR